MVFEVLGFVTGAGVIGAAWMVLLHRDRQRVLAAIRGQGGRTARNALIWPSR